MESERKIVSYDPNTGEPIYEEAKKIVSYDPNTGEPIYEGANPTNEPVNTNINVKPKQTKKSNEKIIFIVCGVVAFFVVAFIVLFVVFGIKAINNTFDEFKSDSDNYNTTTKSTFYGEGFELEYEYPWTKSSVQNKDNTNSDALEYGYKEIYFVSIGNSALDKTATTDFSTTEGKKQLYDDFYKYWNDDNTLRNGSSTFYILKDNIYYAYMDYVNSQDEIKGRMYLVVSEENNIVLSFMSNIQYTTPDEEQKEVLELLKTIKIDSVYNDEISSYLEDMSNWNRYKDVRSGSLGTKKTIEGSWRILSDGESYWVFKDNEYYWYKSYKDLNDNYWYGTTQIFTGKEGLRKVGIEEDKLDKIVANANGKVTDKDIYTILFTPKKIISDGVDKSSTNITGEDWKFVWILVDHGSEGIEAQQLNVNTADINYFVKIKD